MLTAILSSLEIMAFKKIYYHELKVSSALRDKKKLSAFLLNIFKSENTILEKVDIIFCSDPFLLKLNIHHLDHNEYTDTITFHFQPKNKPVVGEVYISINRVRENSKKLQIPYRTELHRVIIHGILHLCGYSDKGVGSFKMLKKQEEHLARYIVPRETPKI